MGEKVVIQLNNINKFTKVEVIRINNCMIVRNLPNSYTYYYRMILVGNQKKNISSFVGTH